MRILYVVPAAQDVPLAITNADRTAHVAHGSLNRVSNASVSRPIISPSVALIPAGITSRQPPNSS